MRNLLLVLILMVGFVGCSRKNDDGTAKDPGAGFLHPGGDVAVGGKTHV